MHFLDESPEKKLTVKELKEKSGLKQMVPVLGPLLAKSLVNREKDKKEKLVDSEYISVNAAFMSKLR
jgi:hypothetical protein